MKRSYKNAVQQSVASHRRLAVVAPAEELGKEVARRFAREGEEVDVAWFGSVDELLARCGSAAFEAVIYFAGRDASQVERDEAAVRGRLHAPCFTVCG